MSVIFTLFVLAVGAFWGMVVLTRLGRLRGLVTRAWKLLDAQLKEGGEAATTESTKKVYNEAVAAYNSALQAFPANIIAGMAGFHAAKPFQP